MPTASTCPASLPLLVSALPAVMRQPLVRQADGLPLLQEVEASDCGDHDIKPENKEAQLVGGSRVQYYSKSAGPKAG